MKSPRFSLREGEIQQVFSSSRLKQTWKVKVRAKMRHQLLPDPIEHLDFHINLSAICAQLEQVVCEGQYLPAPAQRVLMEKSKGLCRQLVLPSIRDALILQCLSDALYADIKGKAPSTRSHFEPDDHRFSAMRGAILGTPSYGGFRAWLDFQKEIFSFTDNYKLVIITDIANYYDTISYTHLRNIVASNVHVRESILDMLIFILASLLWQPDYAPRVEIGLPQMDIDAVRILAHCFLYELDSFLEKNKIDFARFMDDIDIGVDSVISARLLLRDMDLILHARQVRLNTGKTLILRSLEAERHFRVRENYLLNRVASCIDRKTARGLSLDREQRHIRRAVHRYYRRGAFDGGNGDKILKRLLTISKRIGARINPQILEDILRRRPAVRSAVFGLIEWQPLTLAAMKLVSEFLTSGIIVDDATYVEGANALIHAEASSRADISKATEELATYLVTKEFSGVYATLWLISKYQDTDRICYYLELTRHVWRPNIWLGRLVGDLSPLFYRIVEEQSFYKFVRTSRNQGAIEVMEFHHLLRSDSKTVNGVAKIIKARNESKRLGITHAKFLMLLSVLANDAVAEHQRASYLREHERAWKDPFYRWRAQRVLTSPTLRALTKT